MSAAWIPVRTADGSWTLASGRHGEACHSRSGAWQQARERYAGATRIAQLARGLDRPLRLLDVGTGLGLNLAAALAELDGLSLEAVSLERDRAVLAAGLALPLEENAPWTRWWSIVRGALREALERADRDDRSVTALDLAGRGRLELILGDARQSVGALSGTFDAVFLDPFSPRTEPELWSEEFLAAIARAMAPVACLSTYSAAFAPRLALARAGLVVGRGPRVGQKSSGTLAGRGVDLPGLDPRTARRLSRRLAERPIPSPAAVSPAAIA